MQAEKSIKVPANNQSIAQRGMVFGVAVNDSPYLTEVTIDGKRHLCPAQRAWRDMLRRCFDDGYQERFPTYKGCKPCNEWLHFSNFLLWWEENNKKGYQLDKDLIGDGKTYSPETCVYIPSWLNVFIQSAASKDNKLSTGAYQRKSGRYMAICANSIDGGLSHLGTFDTEHDAHLAWKNKKLEYALALKPKMDAIDSRIYNRVVQIIERMQ